MPSWEDRFFHSCTLRHRLLFIGQSHRHFKALKNIQLLCLAWSQCVYGVPLSKSSFYWILFGEWTLGLNIYPSTGIIIIVQSNYRRSSSLGPLLDHHILHLSTWVHFLFMDGWPDLPSCLTRNRLICPLANLPLPTTITKAPKFVLFSIAVIILLLTWSQFDSRKYYDSTFKKQEWF